MHIIPLEETALLEVAIPSGMVLQHECAVDDSLEFVLLVLSKKYDFEFADYTVNSGDVKADEDPRLEMDKTVGDLLQQFKSNRIKLIQAEKLYSNIAVLSTCDDDENQSELKDRVIAPPEFSIALVVQQRLGKHCVMAGSFDALVDCLLDTSRYVHFPKEHDTANYTSELLNVEKHPLVEAFMMMFHALLTPSELLKSLWHRAKRSMQTQTMLSLAKLLKYWVETYWSDFGLNTSVEELLSEIVREMTQQKDTSLRLQVGALRQSVAVQKSLCQPLASTFYRKGKAISSILEFLEAKDVVDQLCLHHYDMFKRIYPTEYLYYIWFGSSKKKSTGQSVNQFWTSADACDAGAEFESDEEHHNLPKHYAETRNLEHCISRFDLESNWAATEILSVTDLRRRTKILKKMIQIAHGCLDKSNYFAAFAILGGLSMNSVQRLKKTWDGIDSATKDALAGLEQMSNPSKNMRHYRLSLCQSKHTCIPLLPVDLKDLTFMHEIPTYINVSPPESLRERTASQKLFNVDKFVAMYKRIVQIQQYTKVPYDNVIKSHAVYNYIDNPVTVRTRQHFQEMSILCEP